MGIARLATGRGSELALIDAATGTWQRTGLSGDASWLTRTPLDDAPIRAARAEKIEHALLLPPVVPQTIVGVGLNYRAHAAEQGLVLPTEPRIFLKNARSLAAPFADLPLHPASPHLDYEAELGIVIGRDIFDVTPAEAEAAIAGWVIMQDYTLRDLVRPETLPLGKGGPAMAPLGPWLTPVSKLPIAHACQLGVRCWVNGELRQDASTADMHFGPVDLVHYIARYIALGPGDVIATGSPGGSGVGLSPPRWLAPGDIVETEIVSLGRLRQRVIEPE
ncbi:MAG: fumarylacetoacetate hydrolase family protein [Erythrobacter sp.]|jgi:2-keto-4-pentenoate hydratase/2-oxohepta-3-ene-1,7-dioic acid hydratase in catechol pathway|nr:fumarylacetoacetate hydrolase family protein [Erythrobacter sp.]